MRGEVAKYDRPDEPADDNTDALDPLPITAIAAFCYIIGGSLFQLEMGFVRLLVAVSSNLEGIRGHECATLIQSHDTAKPLAPSALRRIAAIDCSRGFQPTEKVL